MATGTLAPIARYQAFDSNGNPVSGAKLYTFEAGTSTPAETWSNVELTSSNANPLIASSTGLFGPIFLETGHSYKFVLNNASDVLLWSQDNVTATPSLASTPAALNGTCDLRLSLTSGVPVTTADVTAATLVYIEPYQGNRLSLYDGTSWNARTVSAASFSTPAVANGVYDVFAYDNNGVPGFETLVWTSDTARATGLTVQDGILSKSGQVTRRYLGSFRTTGVSGQTEDSAAKRYLFNYYHRVRKPLRVVEATNSWGYTVAAWQQANAAAGNQVDILCGWAEVPIDLTVNAVGSNNTGGVNFYAGIGEDGITLATGVMNNVGPAITGGNAIRHPATARLLKFPAVGRHYYTWLEYSEATGVTTWYGDNGGVISQSGLFGYWEC